MPMEDGAEKRGEPFVLYNDVARLLATAGFDATLAFVRCGGDHGG